MWHQLDCYSRILRQITTTHHITYLGVGGRARGIVPLLLAVNVGVVDDADDAVVVVDDGVVVVAFVLDNVVAIGTAGTKLFLRNEIALVKSDTTAACCFDCMPVGVAALLLLLPPLTISRCLAFSRAIRAASAY